MSLHRTAPAPCSVMPLATDQYGECEKNAILLSWLRSGKLSKRHALARLGAAGELRRSAALDHKMNRPLEVTVAQILHLLFANFIAFGFFLIIKTHTAIGTIFLISIIVIHTIAFIGFLKRSAWTRRFSLWIFTIYLILNLMALPKLAKLHVTWKGWLFVVLFFTLLVWIINGLKSSIAVLTYFNEHPS